MKHKIVEYLKSTQYKSIQNKEISEYLDSVFPNVIKKTRTLTLKVKAAMVILGFEEEPGCLTCGGEVELSPNRYKFSPIERQSDFYSFKPYCSKGCMHNSSLVVEARRKTNLEKYGADSWAKSIEGKEFLSQEWNQAKKDKFNKSYKKTANARYGVDHYSKTPEYLEQRASTNIEKFGVENPFQSKEIKSKILVSNQERYRVNYYQQSEEGRKRLSDNSGMKNPEVAAKSRLNRMLKSIKDETIRYCLINKDRDKFKEYLDSFDAHNRYELSKKIQLSHSYLNNILRQFDMRDLYLSTGSSQAEFEIYEFIKTLYSGKIILNDRSTIPGQRELDIYLPELNMAIEYDGLRWHSEGYAGKDSLYHLSKTVDCEKLGIQLLHIFENEWLDFNKKEIWKSIIRNKLKLNTEKYYARKCNIKEIDSSAAREFLDKNHLSGFVGAAVHLGMFYEQTLVSVLSYGKSRFEECQEIIRYASLLNSTVIGGFGKFFKLLPKDTITYADRRYSSVANCAYSKFFNKMNTTTPNWFGFNRECELRSRWSFQKHIVSKDPRYIDGASVLDNLINIGYDRIWDCGNLKFSNTN